MLSNFKLYFGGQNFSRKINLYSQIYESKFFSHELFAFMSNDLLQNCKEKHHSEFARTCRILNKTISHVYQPVWMQNQSKDLLCIEENLVEEMFLPASIASLSEEITRRFSNPATLSDKFGYLSLNSCLELINKVRIKTTINYLPLQVAAAAIKKVTDAVDLNAAYLEDPETRSCLLSCLINIADLGHCDQRLVQQVTTLLMEVAPQDQSSLDFYRLVIRALGFMKEVDYAIWHKFKQSFVNQTKLKRATLLYDMACLGIDDPAFYDVVLQNLENQGLNNTLIIAIQGLVSQKLLPETLVEKAKSVLIAQRERCGCENIPHKDLDLETLAFHQTCVVAGIPDSADSDLYKIHPQPQYELVMQEFARNQEELLPSALFQHVEQKKRVCQYRCDLAATVTRNGATEKLAIEISLKQAKYGPDHLILKKRIKKEILGRFGYTTLFIELYSERLGGLHSDPPALAKAISLQIREELSL